MTYRTIRRALALAAISAGLGAAPASATHNGTCRAFQDPACNVQYFTEHNVDPIVAQADPVRDMVSGVVNDVADRVRCPGWGQTFPDCHVNPLLERINETLQPIEDLRGDVTRLVVDTARGVLCQYFGSC